MGDSAITTADDSEHIVEREKSGGDADVIASLSEPDSSSLAMNTSQDQLCAVAIGDTMFPTSTTQEDVMPIIPDEFIDA